MDKIITQTNAISVPARFFRTGAGVRWRGEMGEEEEMMGEGVAK